MTETLEERRQWIREGMPLDADPEDDRRNRVLRGPCNNFVLRVERGGNEPSHPYLSIKCGHCGITHNSYKIPMARKDSRGIWHEGSRQYEELRAQTAVKFACVLMVSHASGGMPREEAESHFGTGVDQELVVDWIVVALHAPENAVRTFVHRDGEAVRGITLDSGAAA